MADHVLGLFSPPDPFSREVRDAFAKRCNEDHWSEDMRSCVGATASVVEPKNCKQKLVPEQAANLEKALKAAEVRETKRLIPASCGRYERVLAKALACDKIPQDVRDGLAKRFADSKMDWVHMDDKSSLVPICTAAIEALKQASLECPGAAKW